MTKKIYFSSAAFARGRSVFTTYASGCVRSILVGANGIRTTIPELFMINGKKNEERFKRDHLEGKRDYQEEQTLREDIPGLDVVHSGRFDFTVTTAEGKTAVIELKNVNSDGSFKKHILQRQVKPENLAQLVKYMMTLRTDVGTLVYSYNKDEPDGTFSLIQEVFHHVRIDNDGKIIINGEETDWRAQEAIHHTLLAAQHVARHELGDRPENWDSEWASPCSYCPWKMACNAYDAGGQTTDLFLDACKVLATSTDKKN